MDYKIYLIATVIVLVAFAVLLYTQFTRIDKRMAIIEEELHEHSLMLNSKGDKSTTAVATPPSHSTENYPQPSDNTEEEAHYESHETQEEDTNPMMNLSKLFTGDIMSGAGVLENLSRVFSSDNYEDEADDEGGAILGETLDADDDALTQSSHNDQEEFEFKIEETNDEANHTHLENDDTIQITLTESSTEPMVIEPIVIEQTIEEDDDTQEDAPQIVYENLTLPQLKNLCEERGIRFTAKTKRMELIDKLKNYKPEDNARTIDIQL
jgi:hypothetical protein